MLYRGTLAVRSLLRRVGLDLVRWTPWPADFDQFDRDVVTRTRPYTMTSPERIVTLIDAIEYVVRDDIPGAIVECGVWRGGSMIAAALTLLRLGELRDLYLYDTFDGMTEPTTLDVDVFGMSATTLLARQPRSEGGGIWAYAPLEKVKQALKETTYPLDRTHFVVGRVEDTIPGTVPARIAILRLDTDWYQSTRHELEQLYPLLVPHGVLIIDDYGYHLGARQAADEYFQQPQSPLLCRVDDTGRL